MEAVIYYTDQGSGAFGGAAGKGAGHREGEYLLKTGLFREYGRRLEEEIREKGPHGKPFFSSCPWIHYSITHSGNYAACAFSEIEVGLDIQVERRGNYPGMLRHMVPEELYQEMVKRADLKEEFFRQWALREAYIKWTGEGFSRSLSTIPFTEGWHQSFLLDSSTYGAIWAGEPLKLRWEYAGEPSASGEKE